MKKQLLKEVLKIAKEIRFNKSMEDPKTYVDEAIKFIENNVEEDEKVVCALSGGVDSSVVTKLFYRAVEDRLYPVHIDTGFMRSIQGEKESEIVERMFDYIKNFKFVDARERFQEAIFGIEDAEDKRLIFRGTYEDILNEFLDKLNATVGTQGTIKADIEETDAGLKSQNNVDTNFLLDKLVEPLAGLYKPDVRKVAKELGFEKDSYMRQPFLGPGLSARTVGAINKGKLETERIANDLLEQFIEKYFEENYDKTALWDKKSGSRIPFQYFTGTFDPSKEIDEEVSEYLKELGVNAEAFTLENKATGVKEEDGERNRIYSPVALLEGDLEPELVNYLGKKIPSHFGVSRVLYQVSKREDGKYIVGIRAVESDDAVYAEPLEIPGEELNRLGEKILEQTEAQIVSYDKTPKPPASIEYE